jgi:hypothetical protein
VGLQPTMHAAAAVMFAADRPTAVLDYNLHMAEHKQRARR